MVEEKERLVMEMTINGRVWPVIGASKASFKLKAAGGSYEVKFSQGRSARQAWPDVALGATFNLYNSRGSFLWTGALENLEQKVARGQADTIDFSALGTKSLVAAPQTLRYRVKLDSLPSYSLRRQKTGTSPTGNPPTIGSLTIPYGYYIYDIFASSYVLGYSVQPGYIITFEDAFSRLSDSSGSAGFANSLYLSETNYDEDTGELSLTPENSADLRNIIA